jgi:hypothetical protein
MMEGSALPVSLTILTETVIDFAELLKRPYYEDLRAGQDGASYLERLHGVALLLARHDENSVVTDRVEAALRELEQAGGQL